jgi:hypothetical protein
MMGSFGNRLPPPFPHRIGGLKRERTKTNVLRNACKS